MIDAETALERIRWHAESGASSFDNMTPVTAFEAARCRLLSILAVFDQFDGDDDLWREGVGVKSRFGKDVFRYSYLQQSGKVKVLGLKLSNTFRLAVNDNRAEPRPRETF